MKYIVVLCDGMSDRPLDELEGKTPLEVAKKPNMDSIAAKGNSGLLRTIYPDLPSDSGVANLTILGYDPHKYYPGRGPLEAMNMDLHLTEKDVALRCNTVTVKDGLMDDYSAGHITSEEAKEVVDFINNELGSDKIEFHPGIKYRHIIILRDEFSKDLKCSPPHDIIGQKISEHLIKNTSPDGEETAKVLNDLTLKSSELLKDHPVNVTRRKEGRNEVSMMWFWGPGRKPTLPAFKSKFGIEGSIISAVDIIKGIGRVAGLEVINVPGATGYLDTNYEGKADAALKALEEKDFVYIHLESTDEAGHEGSIKNKIQAIEDIDKRVIGRVLDNIKGDYAIGVVPDHATPVSVKTHTDDLVQFAVYSTKGEKKDKVTAYSEKDAKDGFYGVKEGIEFMQILTGQ